MRTLLSWSTGKDSAWALHVLRQQPDVDVVGLVTTINAAFDRVAMHGVRRALVEAQAEAAGLPLHVLAIPYPCPNAEYERIMGAFVARAGGEGIEAMAFGDLFLEDIRRYREAKLAGTGLTPLFPLWGIETGQLARTMIDGGLEAYVACVDPRKLPAELRRPALRCHAAGGPAGGRRPLRRERRVPHLRLRRPDVPLTHCRRGRRDRHPRRLRVLRPAAATGPFSPWGGPVGRMGALSRGRPPHRSANDLRPRHMSCRQHAAVSHGLTSSPKGEAKREKWVERSATRRRPRIVSLIASATEIVCALGARDRLVGRSHECDYPADVLQLPALTEPKFKVEGTSAEIDERVRAIVRDGLSVYRVDGEALKPPWRRTSSSRRTTARCAR